MADPIAETAFLVAYYRALECDRKKPLFQDPFARALAGKRGQFWADALEDIPTASQVVAVRTHTFDTILLELIEQEGVTTVLNLGAGLDTRPYRLALPSQLRWYEVDTAATLAHKQEILKNYQPRCQLVQTELNITDPRALGNFLAEVIQTRDQVLVVMEGVLGYLTPEQVGTLAFQLAQFPAVQWWLFELMIPIPGLPTSETQKRFNQLFASGQSALQFSPPEGEQFFLAYGWQAWLMRPLWLEMKRHRRNHLCTYIWEWIWRTFKPHFWKAVLRSNRIILAKSSHPVVKPPMGEPPAKRLR